MIVWAPSEEYVCAFTPSCIFSAAVYTLWLTVFVSTMTEEWEMKPRKYRRALEGLMPKIREVEKERNELREQVTRLKSSWCRSVPALTPQSPD